MADKRFGFVSLIYSLSNWYRAS